MYVRKKALIQMTAILLVIIFIIVMLIVGRRKAVVGKETTVEPYGPAGITMEVDKVWGNRRRAEVTVHNSSGQGYSGIGGVYCIEKQVDGVWYILKDDNYSINYFDWKLPAGGSYTQRFDWYDHFGVLTKGHYRIVNYLFEYVNDPGSDICVLAEFDI